MPDPVTLTAALTGPLATKADNPNLPETPEEIIASAKEAAAAGAAVVHIHLRDENGQPTADVEIAKRVIDGINSEVDVLVQLSTGVGGKVTYEERAGLVEARPLMASLNVCTMTFGPAEFPNPPAGVRRLAERMSELDVKPELEIYDTGHLGEVLRLKEEGLLAEPLQFSIVLGVSGGMPATPEHLNLLIANLPEGSIWQVIAIGRRNLEMTALGLALGGNARTGMEDTLKMRRGEPVRSNAELVERLARVAQAIERPIRSAAETAEALQLPVPAGS